jgi:hypothetical protein
VGFITVPVMVRVALDEAAAPEGMIDRNKTRIRKSRGKILTFKSIAC